MALSAEDIREFVIAAHFNLDKVQEMLEATPMLLTAQHQWGPDDFEDGIGAAAHVGNRAIAEFFLAQGVRSNICVAAMLGREDQVAAALEADPAQANARGAHGIPVMFHAAMSGNIEVAELLKKYGCNEGYSMALHGAITHGHTPMIAWLLGSGADDLTVQDYQGKTLLQRAAEANMPEAEALLRQHGATA